MGTEELKSELMVEYRPEKSIGGFDLLSGRRGICLSIACSSSKSAGGRDSRSKSKSFSKANSDIVRSGNAGKRRRGCLMGKKNQWGLKKDATRRVE